MLTMSGPFPAGAASSSFVVISKSPISVIFTDVPVARSKRSAISTSARIWRGPIAAHTETTLPLSGTGRQENRRMPTAAAAMALLYIGGKGRVRP